MGTASETYEKKVKEAKKLLSDISKSITKYSAKQKKEPRNWAYAGIMSHAVKELQDLKEWLG